MHRKADLKKRWETFDGRQLRDCAILCPFPSHPKGAAAGMRRPWNDAPEQQAAVPAAIFRVPPPETSKGPEFGRLRGWAGLGARYYDVFRGPLIEHMIFYLTKTGGDARRVTPFFPKLL